MEGEGKMEMGVGWKVGGTNGVSTKLSTLFSSVELNGCMIMLSEIDIVLIFS